MAGLRKAIVIIAAVCMASVSENKSIEKPKRKETKIKNALFCFIGYQ